MCNDYGNRVAYSEYVEEFSHLKIPVLRPEAGAIPNLEPRDEIWPSEAAPVLRAYESGVELVQLPWGLAPGRPKAPLVIKQGQRGPFVSCSGYPGCKNTRNLPEGWTAKTPAVAPGP